MINVKTIILGLVFALTVSLGMIAKAASDSPDPCITADLGERSDFLLSFVINGDNHAVTELLKCPDVDLNVRGGNRRMTPLMFAAQEGHSRIVRMLLDQGADPDLEDNNRYTAMNFSYESGHSSITRMLQDAGATNTLPAGRSAETDGKSSGGGYR